MIQEENPLPNSFEPTHPPMVSKVGPQTLAIGLALLLSVIVFWPRPLVIVGDGGDYIAMTIAWGETGAPWVDPRAATIYGTYFKEGQAGRSWNDLVANFARLRDTEGRQDFCHFWFYSLLASGFYRLATLFHFKLYYAFLLLHVFLVLGVARLSHYYHGWNGVCAFLMLILGSPLLWFSQKIHTEFFIFCCTTSFVIFLLSRKKIEAAICLATASTQNPVFAVPSAAMCLWFVVEKKGRVFQLPELWWLLGWSLLLALHPLYYLWRYGVLTPQLYVGDSNLSNRSLDIVMGPLFDLNVGLLANWPLSLLMMGAGGWWVFRSGKRHHTILIAFACYLACVLYGGSKNLNYNSGGTVHLIRYATWLVCLFYPVVLVGMRGLFCTGFSSLKAGLLPLTLVGLVLNFSQYEPGQPETNTKPSHVAAWVNRHCPGWYHPIPEIFIERNIFRAELPLSSWIGGTFNGRQLLIFPQSIPDKLEGEVWVAGVQGRVRLEKIGNLLKQAFQENPGLKRKPWFYLDLSEEEARTLVVLPELACGKEIRGGGDPEYFNVQWNQQEDWGRWSAGPDAALNFQWSGRAPSVLRVTFCVFQMNDSDQTSVAFEWNGTTIWNHTYQGPAMGPFTETIPLPSSLSVAAASNELKFVSKPSRSPMNYGSSDSRTLGIGLISLRLD
jgi:hypothetical protein